MTLTRHLARKRQRGHPMHDHQNEGRGSRSIGSLTSKIASSPEALGSALALETLPRSSGTTGSRSLAPRDASSTGRQLSETAAATLPSIAEAIALADPQALDLAIVRSLPPSIGSALKAIHRDIIDPVYGLDTEFVGYELPRAGVVPAELMQARQMVGLHLKPAVGGLIKQELARLRVSTKSRSESADDLVMGFQVMAEECSEYPADVVVWALRGWARSEVFYPSLAEIRDRLQRGARRRKAMMAALVSIESK